MNNRPYVKVGFWSVLQMHDSINKIKQSTSLTEFQEKVDLSGFVQAWCFPLLLYQGIYLIFAYKF